MAEDKETHILVLRVDREILDTYNSFMRHFRQSIIPDIPPDDLAEGILRSNNAIISSGIRVLAEKKMEVDKELSEESKKGIPPHPNWGVSS